MQRRGPWGTALGGMLVMAALWSACAGPSPLDSPDAGRAASYDPGVPNFEMEAVAGFRDGQPGLDVFVSLPWTSLVFARTDSGFAARYELSVRIEDERGRRTEAFRTSTDTLAAASADEARADGRVRHLESFALPAGRYLVETIVTDLDTGADGLRRQRVELEPGDGGPWLGRPLLYAAGQELPLVSLHVPADQAALSVRTAVHGTPPGATLRVGLFRLPSDSTVAHPPFWLQASRGSLAYRGVEDDLAEADTVLLRPEPPPAGTDPVAVDLPELKTGIYRFTLDLVDEAGDVIAEQERTISIQNVGFPRIETLSDLIDALAYIAYPRERDYIREGLTPADRRQRFDAFWGALVPDRQVAATLLRQYYERVEEANLLFTAYKAGWKTDRGTIYVVFGAPAYVEQTFEGEVWHYDFSGQDPAGTFAFERPAYGRSAPFDHLVLVRQPLYERAWTRAVERWRRGAAF